MFTRLFILFLSYFFLLSNSQAQSKGILPLTGIRYFNEGIWARDIEVKADGATLVSNHIPLNKDVEISLLVPTGFIADKTNMIFAAAELDIISLKGIVLLKTANVFKDNEAKGFPAGTFKEVIVKINLKSEVVKTDPGCVIKIRYYDLKSKNQLRLEFPVIIARPGEALEISKSVTDIKSVTPIAAKACGVKIKNITVTVDTSIRVSPKMAYTSLEISNIEGTSITEVLSGKESFWVYDADLNEVKMTDRQLKQVGAAMENNIVNYLSKIPYRLKTTIGKLYTVRFRWESQDKRKIIDIVVLK